MTQPCQFDGGEERFLGIDQAGDRVTNNFVYFVFLARFSEQSNSLKYLFSFAFICLFVSVSKVLQHDGNDERLV